jgi:hypothetical protein
MGASAPRAGEGDADNPGKHDTLKQYGLVESAGFNPLAAATRRNAVRRGWVNGRYMREGNGTGAAAPGNESFKFSD